METNESETIIMGPDIIIGPDPTECESFFNAVLGPGMVIRPAEGTVTRGPYPSNGKFVFNYQTSSVEFVPNDPCTTCPNEPICGISDGVMMEPDKCILAKKSLPLQA